MTSANLARFYLTKAPQQWTSLPALEHLDILPTEQLSKKWEKWPLRARSGHPNVTQTGATSRQVIGLPQSPSFEPAFLSFSPAMPFGPRKTRRRVAGPQAYRL